MSTKRNKTQKTPPTKNPPPAFAETRRSQKNAIPSSREGLKGTMVFKKILRTRVSTLGSGGQKERLLRIQESKQKLREEGVSRTIHTELRMEEKGVNRKGKNRRGEARSLSKKRPAGA